MTTSPVPTPRTWRDEIAVARRLAEQDPDNLERQRELAIACASIGDRLLDEGLAGEAVDAYRTSLAIHEGLAANDPDDMHRQRDVFTGYDRLANALLQAGEHDEGFQAHRNGFAVRERLPEVERESRQWRDRYFSL
ncbi:MAG: hypothetical protein WBP59_14895 [Ilumatobacteraceae bacterium]